MAARKKRKRSEPNNKGDDKSVASLPAEPTEAGVLRRERSSKRALPLFCLTTLGVVYGDIGTSPLYALRECFRDPTTSAHVSVSRDNVLGILSLIAWSLFIVISLKYLVYVMRSDNKGEGGMLALLALMQRRAARRFGLPA